MLRNGNGCVPGAEVLGRSPEGSGSNVPRLAHGHIPLVPGRPDPREDGAAESRQKS